MCTLSYRSNARRNLSSVLHSFGADGSSTPTSPLDANFDEEPAYLIDVIEEVGADVARRCYWDFGRWSDLWRVWHLDPAGHSYELTVGNPILQQPLGIQAPSRWPLESSAGGHFPTSFAAAEVLLRHATQRQTSGTPW